MKKYNLYTVTFGTAICKGSSIPNDAETLKISVPTEVWEENVEAYITEFLTNLGLLYEDENPNFDVVIHSIKQF